MSQSRLRKRERKRTRSRLRLRLRLRRRQGSQQLPLLAGQSVQVLGRANPWGPWWRINRVLR